jgi:neutral amino acid transport system permease protein
VIDAIVQAIFNGIVFGSILAIGALGLTLTWGIVRLINVSHGELLTSGAFGAYFVNVTLGLPLVLAFPASMGVGAGVAIVLEAVLWRPLRRRRLGETQLMLVSIGVALAVRNLIAFFWGVDYKLLDVDRNQAFHIAGISISLLQVVVVIVAAVALAIMGGLLRYTQTGRLLRAVASNGPLAEIAGVDTDRMISLTWVFAGASAGLAGTLIGLLSVIEPNTGAFLLLSLFAASVIGGLGDPFGTLVGALCLGVVQSLATLVINPSYQVAVGFVFMILVLITRPRGIFGRSTTP